MMKLVHGRSRCLRIVGASAKFAGTTKRCRLRPSFGKLVRPSRHNEVVLVQTTNLVSPPGDRYLTPLGQQCGMVPLLLGLLGIRTPDLRRAKSGPYYRGRSPLFKNTCKSTYSSITHFLVVRRCSRGLVYYWCKKTKATVGLTSQPGAQELGRLACARRPEDGWPTTPTEKQASSLREASQSHRQE